MIRLKLRACGRYRPRVLTLAVLLVVATPIAGANFTSELESVAVQNPRLGSIYAKGTYGWPFTWHWHNLAYAMPREVIVGWEYSGARLAANVASWTILLAAPGAACEWLLRRYRPHLRWSLRTLFGGVALASALFAWSAAARNRANLQDSIIAELVHDPQCVVVERPGPTWLEFVVPDSFRRRIAAVDARSNIDGTVDEAFVVRLGRLPQLTYLNLEVEQLTPPMVAALRNLRNLRWLHIEVEQPSSDPLAALGELRQLEGLYLYGTTFTGENLPSLAGLTNLKTLGVEFSRVEGAFAQMPPLPNLEAIEFVFSIVSGQELRRLSVLPSLKALDLKYAEFGTDTDLGDLAGLELLEELTLAGDIVSVEGIESLAALKHLRALHITGRHSVFFKESDVQVTLKLDGGAGLVVLDTELDGFRRALGSLRQAHPGIVIDSDTYAIDRHFGRQPPWDTIKYGGQASPPWDELEPSYLLSTWLPERYRWRPVGTRASGSGTF